MPLLRVLFSSLLARLESNKAEGTRYHGDIIICNWTATFKKRTSQSKWGENVNTCPNCSLIPSPPPLLSELTIPFRGTSSRFTWLQHSRHPSVSRHRRTMKAEKEGIAPTQRRKLNHFESGE